MNGIIICLSTQMIHQSSQTSSHHLIQSRSFQATILITHRIIPTCHLHRKSFILTPGENHVAFKLPCLDVVETLSLRKGNNRQVKKTPRERVSKNAFDVPVLFKNSRKGGIHDGESFADRWSHRGGKHALRWIKI